MAAVARKIGCGFALIGFVKGVCPVAQEQLRQVFPVGDGCGKEGCEAPRLSRIGGRAMVEQKLNDLRIFAQRQGCLQGLVLLWVAADRDDACSGGEDRKSVV